MNLKFRFAFLFSFFVFIIQMASVLAIYLLYEDFRKDEFTNRIKYERVRQIVPLLTSQAINTDSLDALLATSAKNFSGETIAIYNESLQPVYNLPRKSKVVFADNVLNKIVSNGEYTFYKGDNDGYGVKQKAGNSFYLLVIASYDEFGRRKIQNLQYILFFTVLGALLFSGLFAFLYVHQIIRPLGELNDQMQRIGESNLTERVTVRKNTDELRKTAETFNAMLNRLQQAFEMRKSFVHHASHELRTPLASMQAQTEVALKNDLSTNEYKKVLKSLSEDQQDLIDLTNSLLLLSQFESTSFTADWLPVRVDELLYETIEIFKFQQKQAVVNLDFKTTPDDSSYLTIKGNHSLIISAFRNLIKNACLYSDNCQVHIYISANEHVIKVEFENTGEQVKEKDRINLFVPFFRADNSSQIKGTGLGLSIVQRIIELHRGQVFYEPVGDNINRFTITFTT